MAHAEHVVVVPRPIREVYDFLADGLNDPRWRPGVIDVARQLDGEAAAINRVPEAMAG